jgi:hypothetical protein
MHNLFFKAGDHHTHVMIPDSLTDGGTSMLSTVDKK